MTVISSPHRQVELTSLQRAFAVAYATIDSPTYEMPSKSVIAAGYSRKGARVTAHRLLRDTKIQRLISQIKDLRQQVEDVSSALIRKELWSVYHAARVQQPKPDLSVANRSLELLGNSSGVFDQTFHIDLTVAHERSQAELVANRRISGLLALQQAGLPLDPQYLDAEEPREPSTLDALGPLPDHDLIQGVSQSSPVQIVDQDQYTSQLELAPELPVALEAQLPVAPEAELEAELEVELEAPVALEAELKPGADTPSPPDPAPVQLSTSSAKL